MNDNPVVVIGGGAAGLMCAGRAAMGGRRVIVLEKMKKCGLKIGISGKGRCNLTNIAPLEEFMTHFGKDGRFLRQCFQSFFTDELQDFFARLGVPLVVERGGRVFPKSGRALDVVNALNRWLIELGVEVRNNQRVSEILAADGQVEGVVHNGTTTRCSEVVIATGGKSYQRTGSTGDGYGLAAMLGHPIQPPAPALVPLNSSTPFLLTLEGLELKNVSVRLFVDKKKVGQVFGELFFRDGAIAGPTVLSLSSLAVPHLEQGRKVRLSIDLKPALDEKKLDARILRDFDRRGGEPIAELLRGLLPAQLVEVALTSCNISREVDTKNFPRKARKQLVQWTKNLTMEITGHRGWAEAIITAGGISLKEVDPRSMESKIVAGLYLAGEVLNLQADTGGFNLQAAFSTGWLAGTSVHH